MQRNNVSRFKIVSMASYCTLNSFLDLCLYQKLKLYNQSLKQFWQCFTYVSRSYDPTVLPCKSKPSPFNESFVLALDYMLYAFYDLKLISWPWRVQLQPQNRSDDILLYLLLAIRSTLLKPAAQSIIHHFLPVFQ
jgi:hypothetical protein